jgi:hypothetical protein
MPLVYMWLTSTSTALNGFYLLSVSAHGKPNAANALLLLTS